MKPKANRPEDAASPTRSLLREAASTPAETSVDETAGESARQTELVLRRQAESALRLERERAQGYLDTVETIIVALDAEGKITTINRKGCQLLGWAEHELIGQFWFSFCLPPPDGVEEMYPTFRTMLAGKTRATEYYENPILTRSGELRQIAWHNALLRDEQGRIVGTLSSGDDITERRRAEDEIAKARQELESLFNLVPDMIAVASPDGYFKRVNPEWEKTLGYTVQELLSTPYPSLIHPDDLPRTKSDVERQLQGGTTIRFENRYRHQDGSYRWLEWNATPAVGNLHYAVARDITERKQAEDALRESEQRFRNVFEKGPLGMVTTSVSEGRFTGANAVFCEMLGYTEEELKRLSFADVTHPDHRSRDVEAVKRLWEEQIPHYKTEKRYLKKNGETLWGSVTASVIRSTSGKPLYSLAMIEDISERKRAEEEKARLEAQLQQAQKMESVGRLAGGVAHDFNNMLGVILGHAELALGQVDPAQPLHADLQQIREAANRSADLTRQLLAFARRQTVAPKILDLNETVAGMLKMLQRLIGEDIDLKWQPEADLWKVNVDPSQVDQMLANLCVNARDAISGVGTMIIATGNSTIDQDDYTAHAGNIPGEYVRLTVSDDGCGMDKETLSHLFEPFFTTKAMGKGTGLGLATVYGIVKQNNGFFDVRSRPNQGTTFRIYLPRHVGKAGPARIEDPTRGASRGLDTILVVEDEPFLLSLTKRMLEHQGYTVLAASTPGEALRLAKEHTGDIDLLITDVIMPEMNGRTLARNLLSLYPLVKRLFMSGYTADVIAHHGVLDEGVHFIQKPFSTEDLATKVRDALDALD